MNRREVEEQQAMFTKKRSTTPRSAREEELVNRLAYSNQDKVAALEHLQSVFYGTIDPNTGERLYQPTVSHHPSAAHSKKVFVVVILSLVFSSLL